MHEEMRRERLVLDLLYDGAATLTETAAVPGSPAGTVAVRVDGDLVGWGRTFREALTAAATHFGGSFESHLTGDSHPAGRAPQT